LFNLETMKFRLWLDSNPEPHASQADPLSTIPNFLMKDFSKSKSQILKDFYNLSAAESPVGSNNNRWFLLKRQKTRIVNNFWSRSNFYMKFSGMYVKVHNLQYLLLDFPCESCSTKKWSTLILSIGIFLLDQLFCD